MARTVTIGLDTSSFSQGLKNAASEVERVLAQPAARASEILGDAFDRAFARMSQGLVRLAQTGELSIRAMVNAMIADLSRLAFERFVAEPITGLLEGLVKGLFGFGGARAGGGPVAAGASYLVGERGPELFVPAGSGAIRPWTESRGGAPAIHFHITTPDAESFRRSETQVSAMLARAVRRGGRAM